MTASLRIGALLLVLCPCLFAQGVPLANDQPPPSPMLEWRLQAGKEALSAGLPSLAESFFSELAGNEAAPATLRNEARLQLVSALVAQRRMGEVERVMSEVQPPYDPRYYLRQALYFYFKNDFDNLALALDSIDPDALSAAELPWFYMLDGLLKKHNRDTTAATFSFDEAQRLSRTPAQRAQFEAFRLGGRIIAGEVDDETADVLQQRLEENLGTRIGMGFARQYAVVLHQLGRNAQAVEVLRAQLKYLTPEEKDEEAHLQLLIGLISGVDSTVGQLALLDVLKNNADRSFLKVALYHLSQRSLGKGDDELKKRFRKSIDTLIKNGSSPLQDELLLLRAWMKLQEGKSNSAAADAERLLDEYPGSTLREEATFLLAYVAWTAEQPRYRSAADLLGRMREFLPLGQRRAQLGRLMADCYFLNGDYKAAADVYALVLNESRRAPLNTGIVRFQLVQAHVRTGNLPAARETLTAWWQQDSTGQELLWRAEWNFINALRESGAIDDARSRAAALAERSGEVRPALRLRFMWLEASLAYQTRDYTAAINASRSTRNVLAATADAALAGIDRSNLDAYLDLIEGQCLLNTGKTDTAIELFNRLRKNHPGSEAAVLSYFEEAHFLAAQFKLAAAQRLMRELADSFPEHPNAPAALLETALLSEQHGLERNLLDALDIAA